MRRLRASCVTAMAGLACLLATAGGTRAEDALPAKDVVRGCQGFMNTLPRELFLFGVCYGVVHNLVASGRDLKTAPFCPPAAISTAAAAQVAMAYIDARPQRKDEPFQRLAAEAFAAAWPCR